MSVKFLSAILGPEMGCVNFMDAWKNALFLQEKNHVHKIPRFRGGGGILGFGGGSADFIFMGARIFLKVSRYKWEAYRDTNWWCIYYFLPR